MFENLRRGRQARNFTTNVPKILDLKSSSEQIFSRKLPLGAPDMNTSLGCVLTNTGSHDPTDVAISFKIYRNVGVGDVEGVFIQRDI